MSHWPQPPAKVGLFDNKEPFENTNVITILLRLCLCFSPGLAPLPLLAQQSILQMSRED